VNGTSAAPSVLSALACHPGGVTRRGSVQKVGKASGNSRKHARAPISLDRKARTRAHVSYRIKAAGSTHGGSSTASEHTTALRITPTEVPKDEKAEIAVENRVLQAPKAPRTQNEIVTLLHADITAEAAPLYSGAAAPRGAEGAVSTSRAWSTGCLLARVLTPLCTTYRHDPVIRRHCDPAPCSNGRAVRIG